MLSSFVVPAAWLLQLAAVKVGGATTCPTPAAVQRTLGTMMGAAVREVGGARHAQLMQTERGLLVTLHSLDGSLLAEKQFAATASCADLASAAAVVIATWEGELEGETSLTLQALPQAAAVPPPSQTRWLWRFGVAGGATKAAASFAPVVSLDASLGTGRAWQAAALAFAEGTHDRPLGMGEGAWQRTGLGLGPRLWWQKHNVWLGLDALLYGAFLRLQGRGHTTDVKDVAWDAGAMAAVRVGWQLGSVSPFVVASASRSFVTRTFAVEPGAETPMPGAQLALMAGFSWRLTILSAQ